MIRVTIHAEDVVQIDDIAPFAFLGRDLAKTSNGLEGLEVIHGVDTNVVLNVRQLVGGESSHIEPYCAAGVALRFDVAVTKGVNAASVVQVLGSSRGTNDPEGKTEGGRELHLKAYIIENVNFQAFLVVFVVNGLFGLRIWKKRRDRASPL